jgi:hypothetical protein
MYDMTLSGRWCNGSEKCCVRIGKRGSVYIIQLDKLAFQQRPETWIGGVGNKKGTSKRDHQYEQQD